MVSVYVSCSLFFILSNATYAYIIIHFGRLSATTKNVVHGCVKEIGHLWSYFTCIAVLLRDCFVFNYYQLNMDYEVDRMEWNE